MSDTKDPHAGPDAFAPGRRRAIKFSDAMLVRTGYLAGDEGRFPLVCEPGAHGVNLAAWAESHRGLVLSELLKHGALLFRGFGINSVERFEELARAATPELMDYYERAAPRLSVGRNVYTSTEYPAGQAIPLHHEMSYSHNWPAKIWFYCAQPARSGGATPIADDRKVFWLLDPEIKECFLRKRVMYVRNYGEGLDLSWREAFQTDDRAAVEEYCRRARMSCEWRAGDRLRTRAVRQVVATHPHTGETVWFNHAHMFHVSNVEPGVRAALLSQFAEDELPRNAFYGDGSPLEAEVLAEIRRVYGGAAVRFQWREGDVLLLDNFLASHGREPFEGPRRVLVAMAELYTNQDL
ncbi:MAG TPA: TauD/TfdA family dioxygenase [Pyrinomonadaceae bacterium]|nr:TauD/TfdA family dioxygenase [Pyrinomonadaceae bacterium]